MKVIIFVDSFPILTILPCESRVNISSRFPDQTFSHLGYFSKSLAFLHFGIMHLSDY